MIMARMGFTSKTRMYSFMTLVMSGQLIYSSFEAFKGTFYVQLLEILNISNTQLGLLFTIRGLSMFFFILSAWINNRFSVKKILFWCCSWRLLTMLMIIYFRPAFPVLVPIFFTWAICESIFWAAVVNGISIESGDNKGLGFGLFESIRRAVEMVMNLLLVSVMSIATDAALVFHNGMYAYTLIIIPLLYYIWKFLPDNIDHAEENKNKVAWSGVLKMLGRPSIWLAGVISMTIYWNYIVLIYTVPYLHSVFHTSDTLTSTFGAINTDGIGIISGVCAGLLADFVFRSPTKIISFSLCGAGICLLILISHVNSVLLNISIILLFSFFTFMAKGVILAPVAEMNFPPDVSGSAMSIASFLTYSPNFFAYTINGWFLDRYSAISPILAYNRVFLVGAAVSISGALVAAGLVRHINKTQRIRTVPGTG